MYSPKMTLTLFYLNLPVRSLGWEDPLEEGTATYSSILAQRITWTEEPGGLGPQDSKELDMSEATQHTACILFEYIACGEGMSRRNVR